MQVREVMTKTKTFLHPDVTIRDAAKEMQRNDFGFVAIGDGVRLLGVATDRDLVVRGFASGKDSDALLSEVMTEKVFYCYDTDDLNKVANNMEEQQVRRLIVVDKNKDLVGIVSLGDIATKCNDLMLAGELIEKVSEPTH